MKFVNDSRSDIVLFGVGFTAGHEITIPPAVAANPAKVALLRRSLREVVEAQPDPMPAIIREVAAKDGEQPHELPEPDIEPGPEPEAPPVRRRSTRVPRK